MRSKRQGQGENGTAVLERPTSKGLARKSRGNRLDADSATEAGPVKIRLVDPIKPRRIKVRVRGVNELLLDPMSDEQTEAMIKKKTLTPSRDRTLKRICEDKLSILRDPNTGKLGIPRKYWWGCLHNAGEYVKYKGKMNIATASPGPGKSAKSRLASFFAIETKFAPLTDEHGLEPNWEIDKAVGNGASSKNGICRPRIQEDWEAEFIFQYDDGDVHEDTIRELLRAAGRMIGIGCKRACLKGGECGQFTVVSWIDITPSDWPNANEGKPKSKRAASNGDDKEDEVE